MHAFLLERIAKEIEGKFLNIELVDAFTTAIDELNLVFGDDVIKINFFQGRLFFQTPDFGKLQKKNRLPIFASLIGRTLQSVKIHPYERSFSLIFKEGEELHFFGYGKFSQITHYVSRSWEATFPLKNKRIDYAGSTNKIEVDETTTTQQLKFLTAFQISQLVEKAFDSSTVAEKKQSLNQLRDEYLSGLLYINKTSQSYDLSYRRENECIAHFESALVACDHYARLYISHQVFTQTKANQLAVLTKELKRIDKKIKSAKIQIGELQKASRYKDKADLIMANLWQLEKGMTDIKLPSFDGDQWIKVQLKKDLTPQANAARLYRKGKNEKMRLQFAEENLKKMLETHQKKLEEIQAVQQTEDLKALRKNTISKQTAPKIKLPYRLVHYDGFEIRVGKGARENDELLRNHTSKFDLWLHAKDVSGSHVIIFNPNKKEVPNSVLERAAELAAYYSKARTEQLAAVHYTHRKYVRKPKGAHPGSVKIDHQNTMLVEPNL